MKFRSMRISNVYIMKGTPGALVSVLPDGWDIKEWTEICHQKQRFIFIDYDRFRYLSRHTLTDNKRPYIVKSAHHDRLGASSTLAGAIKIARRLVEANHATYADEAQAA